MSPFWRFTPHTPSWTTSAMPAWRHTTWKGTGASKVRRVKLFTLTVKVPGKMRVGVSGRECRCAKGATPSLPATCDGMASSAVPPLAIPSLLSHSLAIVATRSARLRIGVVSVR
eukprot:scaffold57191_cov64-Phaeocystis_antarctica.AAC.2